MQKNQKETRSGRSRAKPRIGTVSFVIVMTTLTLGAAMPKHGTTSGDPIELEEAKIIIEINATDGDAGLQIMIDGEPWEFMEVFNPAGQSILEIEADRSLERQGLTEFFFESSEPNFEEQPLEVFLRRFPEGEYEFVGETIEGDKLIGSAELTHRLPTGPIILAPEEGGEEDPDDTVIVWAGGNDLIRVVSYQVIVERDEDPLRVFSVDLPGRARRVTVPPEFMEPGTDYKVEVIAIEESGNQTITEVEFSTED